MKRIEHFYVGDKEVNKELWFEVYNDFNNFETLTIKYEDASERDNARLMKEIERLNKEVEKLKKKNYDITPQYPWYYPSKVKFNVCDGIIPEYSYKLKTNNPSLITFTTSC